METPLAETTNPLSREDKARLRVLENEIQDDMGKFIRVGRNLMEIRDTRLYRDEFKDFDEYCKMRWDFGRNYAYRLISSAEVISSLSETLLPIGNKETNGVGDIPLPTNESQTRPLAQVPEDKRREAWEKVVQTAPEGVITTEHIEKVAKKFIPKKKKRPPKPETPPEVSIKDGEGQEVPAGLRRIFERVPDFQEAINHINAAVRIIKDLSDVQAGKFLSAAQVTIDLNNAKQGIHFTIPHAVCPLCKGSAKERKDKCPCKQTGFVTLPTWEKIPAKEKTAS